MRKRPALAGKDTAPREVPEHQDPRRLTLSIGSVLTGKVLLRRVKSLIPVSRRPSAIFGG